MSARRPFPQVAAAILVLLLAGCAPRPAVRPVEGDPMLAQQARERALRALPEWSLRGRIAVSDGNDGGSGRIQWQQRRDGFVIEIRAPVSRRSWRLSETPAGAVLEGLDEGTRRGPDAGQLLYEAVGWPVPVSDLVAWARGARGSGPAQLRFDESGRPARIEQHGWTVEYRGWQAGPSGIELPERVFASRGAQRVRLVVERWDDGG